MSMNRLFGYAFSRTGFNEESVRTLPELAIGSAPGMSNASYGPIGTEHIFRRRREHQRR